MRPKLSTGTGKQRGAAVWQAARGCGVASSAGLRCGKQRGTAVWQAARGCGVASSAGLRCGKQRGTAVWQAARDHLMSQPLAKKAKVDPVQNLDLVWGADSGDESSCSQDESSSSDEHAAAARASQFPAGGSPATAVDQSGDSRIDVRFVADSVHEGGALTINQAAFNIQSSWTHEQLCQIVQAPDVCTGLPAAPVLKLKINDNQFRETESIGQLKQRLKISPETTVTIAVHVSERTSPPQFSSTEDQFSSTEDQFSSTEDFKQWLQDTIERYRYDLQIAAENDTVPVTRGQLDEFEKILNDKKKKQWRKPVDELVEEFRRDCESAIDGLQQESQPDQMAELEKKIGSFCTERVEAVRMCAPFRREYESKYNDCMQMLTEAIPSGFGPRYQLDNLDEQLAELKTTACENSAFKATNALLYRSFSNIAYEKMKVNKRDVCVTDTHSYHRDESRFYVTETARLEQQVKTSEAEVEKTKEQLKEVENPVSKAELSDETCQRLYDEMLKQIEVCVELDNTNRLERFSNREKMEEMKQGLSSDWRQTYELRLSSGRYADLEKVCVNHFNNCRTQRKRRKQLEQFEKAFENKQTRDEFTESMNGHADRYEAQSTTDPLKKLLSAANVTAELELKSIDQWTYSGNIPKYWLEAISTMRQVVKTSTGQNQNALVKSRLDEICQRFKPSVLIGRFPTGQGCEGCGQLFGCEQGRRDKKWRYQLTSKCDCERPIERPCKHEQIQCECIGKPCTCSGHMQPIRDGHTRGHYQEYYFWARLLQGRTNEDRRPFLRQTQRGREGIQPFYTLIEDKIRDLTCDNPLMPSSMQEFRALKQKSLLCGKCWSLYFPELTLDSSAEQHVDKKDYMDEDNFDSDGEVIDESKFDREGYEKDLDEYKSARSMLLPMEPNPNNRTRWSECGNTAYSGRVLSPGSESFKTYRKETYDNFIQNRPATEHQIAPTVNAGGEQGSVLSGQFGGGQIAPTVNAAGEQGLVLSGQFGGDQCEMCKDPVDPKDKGKKTKMRDLFFFKVLIDGQDTSGVFQKTRLKGCNLVLKGYTSNEKDVKHETIDPIVQKLKGDRPIPDSWKSYKELRKNAGALCFVCWNQLCEDNAYTV
eukprot:COSAG02_NODE_4800_length_4962_cov_3.542875_1_plen_1104_part_00